MADEKNSWMDIAGSLEDIMQERTLGMGLPLEQDNLELIRSMKKYGDEEDECVADMAVFTRRVLKERCGLNIELFTEEDDTEDNQEIEEANLFALLLNERPHTYRTIFPEIKAAVLQTFGDEFTGAEDAQTSIDYFNTAGENIRTKTELEGHVADLDEEEAKPYFEALYKIDLMLADDIDNLILNNL